MTRHYEEYQEEITRAKLVKIICDRCDNEIPLEIEYSERDFELHFTNGESYYDGGYREGWGVGDLCDSCIEWLKDTLIKNGVKLSKIEDSW